MEPFSSHLIVQLGRLAIDADPTRCIDAFVNGVNQLRPDLTIHWMPGHQVPPEAGTVVAQLEAGDVVGSVTVESWPEGFTDSELDHLRSALSALRLMIRQPKSAGAVPVAETTSPARVCHRVCQQTPELLGICSPQGHVLECNGIFASYLGGKPNSLIGRPLRDILLERGEQELLAAAVADVVGAIRAGRSDFDLKGPRGLTTIEFMLNPLADETSRMAGVLLLGRDVGDARRREQQLQERLATADQARRARDEFLSVLSSELRMPLSPIVAGIDAIKQALPDHGQHLGELTSIEQNLQAEVRLIDDLLDLSRLSRGGLSLRLETLDVREIIEQAMAICRAEMNAKRLVVSREFTAEKTLVRADAGRLKQVFRHLLMNAVKFDPIGGRITISLSNDLSLSDTIATLVCQITDTGLGIDRVRLPRLFDGIGSTPLKRTGGGLGVGLMIARGIVGLHGGSLEAFSEGRGKGATFTVRLQTTSMPVVVGMSAHVHADRTLNILIVEDHRDTANIMGKLLQAMGHKVSITGTLAEAKRMASEREFDILISDLGLPDGSGHELGEVLQAHPGMRGIVLSGSSAEADVRKSLQAGFSAHLTKPLDIHVLRQHIRGLAESP